MAWEQFVLNHGSIRKEAVKLLASHKLPLPSAAKPTQCVYSVIHLCNTNFLKAYYGPGTVLSARDIVA